SRLPARLRPDARTPEAGFPHRGRRPPVRLRGDGRDGVGGREPLLAGRARARRLAGHFGERWRAIASSYGTAVETLEYAWGEVPSADDLAARLADLGGAKAVFLTHSETSTGVICDLQALAVP